MLFRQLGQLSLAAVLAAATLGIGVNPVAADATVATKAPSVDIFAPILDDGDNGDHTHGSTIVKLPNGELMAAWFQGNGERDATTTKIMGSRLPAGASDWTEPFVLADTPRIADINPALYVDERDRLWLFWYPVLAGRWETSQLKYVYADQGDYEFESVGNRQPDWAWQDAIYVRLGDHRFGVTPPDSFVDNLKKKLEEYEAYLFAPKEEGGAGMLEIYRSEWQGFYEERMSLAEGKIFSIKEGYPLARRLGWQTKNKPYSLKLENGATRTILPLYSDTMEMSVMALSDDGGKTWDLSEPIVGLAIIQPSMALRSDGTLVAFLRNNGKPPHRIVYSESKDYGKTWTIGKLRNDLFDYGIGSDMTVNPATGHWIFVHNSTESGREHLAVALSKDEGRTWEYRRHLEMDTRQEQGKYHYPAVIADDEGNIHITYTVDYTSQDRNGGGKSLNRHNNIKYVKLDEAWIEEGNAGSAADQTVYSYEKIDIAVDGSMLDETVKDPSGKIARTELEKLPLPQEMKGYLSYLNPLPNGITQEIKLPVKWDMTALADKYKANSWLKDIPGTIDRERLPAGITEEMLPERMPYLNVYIQK